MQISLDEGIATAYRIESYRHGESITVNRVVYTHSLIVMPTRIQAWTPDSFDALQVEHFDLLRELSPDCILFGSGGTFRFPAAELLAPLQVCNIGIEVMDTGAACRTYSVLAAEGRHVVAALLVD